MHFDKSMITPEKLKELRDQLGYSNHEMAQVLGISDQTWLNKISAKSNSGKISKLEYEFLLLLVNQHPKYKIKKM
ncbi:helix-turn-helix transcriptional regulator [Serratia sp. UGAL515B_01]|uniref:helix-turn-helix transcriptional regulator n=1 Tax=Serratia sp. UGAL515B_01 TaxID=2986763 RepID=UPI002952BA31|nr:helix-turn-helix transcriptional regulator [Serratia sp. UGAL515B_01]WON75544.1 helix-turn-helix domain-containing protein [Serratia sp. UGAL515B_01]